MLDYLTAALASFASVEVLLALAVGVVGGMIIGTIGLLFVTPAFFITFQWIEEKVMGRRRQEREKDKQLQ